MITHVPKEKLYQLRAYMFRVREGFPTGEKPDIGLPYEVMREDTGRVVVGLRGELVESMFGLSDSFFVDYADATLENAAIFRELTQPR